MNCEAISNENKRDKKGKRFSTKSYSVKSNQIKQSDITKTQRHLISIIVRTCDLDTNERE